MVPSCFFDAMGAKIVLNFFDVVFLFDVELVDVDAAELLLKEPDVIAFVPDFGLAVQH